MERSQMVRGAVRAIKAAVGLQHEVPYTSSQYMVTNRCSRCHGHGRLICEPCTGSGLRYPYLGKADPRQCTGQPGASAADECPIE
ncbi:hypothetical protein HYH03_011744 [Edaphochlamys debaryana]|uniref:Uncharacterized protein n=1 Tax=Edaphochlamys debaryana TaxID=47281 RepID=A0A835XU66_9CHLO|nr:hypothetical protein HYH03_011744 [Edaphochlamys debaryana]|eukprot:KAG2489795.1 hypothetical protein HYH03_011744 [Edaphochlamys debaryana]